VSKFTLKDGVFSLNLFEFEQNNKLCGEFYHFTDYKYLTRKYACSIEPGFIEEDLEVFSWVWDSSNGIWMMISQRPHTQIFWWDDTVVLSPD
jgi:hypothetical protein